jgi:ABC-type uncharacterized transport system substrate-binding protein
MGLRFFQWWIVFLGLVGCCTFAHASTVAIVSTERSPGYLDVAKAINAELERAGLASTELALYTAAEWTANDSLTGNHRVIVTLGAEALKQVLSHEPRASVVAALLPRIGYERIVRENTRRPPANLSAVFLDQPFGRRVDLVRLILPDAKKLGVLWGPESMLSQSSLSQSAQSRGLGIESSVVANPAGLFVGLKAVLDESDVLLAVADPQVYSSATIANILLATYRARIPMVAFSPAYVKAGAMIAIYATPTQIGQQAASLARLALQGASLPPPQYPNDFEISVNDHVAKSLGLNLDVRFLTEKLAGGSKRP